MLRQLLSFYALWRLKRLRMRAATLRDRADIWFHHERYLQGEETPTQHAQAVGVYRRAIKQRRAYQAKRPARPVFRPSAFL